MQVKPEHCEDFENVWKSRETHLKEFSGFIRFALLRCDDIGEYRSETFWENRAAFDDWRKSEQVRARYVGKFGSLRTFGSFAAHTDCPLQK